MRADRDGVPANPRNLMGFLDAFKAATGAGEGGAPPMPLYRPSWPGLSRPSTSFFRLAGKDVEDRKSTRLNSSHITTSYAVSCLKKKKTEHQLVLRNEIPKIITQPRNAHQVN